MEPNSSSSSPFHQSRVRVRVPFLFFLFIFIFIFITITTPSAHATPSNFHSLYTQHCNDVVPNSHPFPSKPLLNDIGTGYSTGGGRLFTQTHNTTALNFRKGVSFHVQHGGPIVRGSLALKVESAPVISRLFLLNGYYSDSGDKLCMVGTVSHISSESLVVLKLNYPKNTSIFDILVTGTLESVSDEIDFEPISILGLSRKSGYQPTFIGNGRLNGSLVGYDRGERLGMDSLALEKFGRSSRSVCSVVGGFGFRVERYELEYESGNGNPLGGDVGYVPKFFVFRRTRCEDGKMQLLLGFPNSSFHGRGSTFPFEPRTSLIAEGEWIEKENRVLAVACRILNFTESLTNAFVGDCSTRLSFRLPARVSLRNRSSIVGQIWSNRTVNDSGYFGKIGFHRVSEQLMKFLPGYKYEFTEYDTVRKTCDEKKTNEGKGKKYPDEHLLEMRLQMAVRNSTGQTEWVHVSPLFVDGDRSHAGLWDKQLKKSHSSVVNMSYDLTFSFVHGYNFFDYGTSVSTKVYAEGIYDRDNGNLCMIACRHVLSKDQELMEKDTLDCAIKINLQFSPLDAKNRRIVNGTIESTRRKSDPLYFEPMELLYSGSITERQAAKSISRMDLENVMVLISNILACVFVGWQLYYVKKHPDVLPFISIVMLVVLILGYTTPLLSNFEVMFMRNRNNWQDKFLGTGEWHKVNEVIVSVMMLVVFLLQLRLLQLTWCSRQGNGSQKCLRDSERKVLYTTLPLYIAGALISCFDHQWIHTHHTSYIPLHVHLPLHLVRQRHNLWDDLKPYSGFVLDGFLLPQILFNLFFNSGEKALTCAFYFGTTIIRLLPHAYDLYRAHTFPRLPAALYFFYANPASDFFSTAWNIIIPCCGLLFVTIVFLQQRLGGRCILPNKFRQTSCVYEKVSVNLSSAMPNCEGL